ncbi:MAG: hypothetical protein ACRDNW_09145 [Trebonia sp.]
MSGEVKFIHGNDRISQLARRTDIVDDVAQIRDAMAEATGHTPCASPPSSPKPSPAKANEQAAFL